jgi:hypothetical protein
MSKQIKCRDNVIYNNELYTVVNVSRSDSLSIKQNKNSNTVNVKKSQVSKLNHNKYDILLYNKSFYRIKDVGIGFQREKTGSNSTIQYELEEFTTNKNKKKISIPSTDTKIIAIPSEYQEKLPSFLSLVEKYNSALKFVMQRETIVTKEKYLSYKFIKEEDVIDMMNKLLNQCKLNTNQLYKIIHILKKTHDRSFQFHCIYENPFDFIRQEVQLITFEKAEKICQEFNLNIDFKVKCEKWIYSLFFKENAFYMLNWKFNKELNKFCERYSENAREIDIADFVININIDGKEYKTTQFLLELEKKATDLTMDLFYDVEYDIPIEEINVLIETYETKNNKIFEEDQKNGIIRSIKNKLSIITGFPGTGKTEIVKCILFILSKIAVKYFPELGGHEKLSENSDKKKYWPLKNVSLMAPTGLAYINLHRSLEKSFYNEKISGTCHRTLYHTFPKIIQSKLEAEIQHETQDEMQERANNFDIYRYNEDNENTEDNEDSQSIKSSTGPNGNNDNEKKIKLIILDETSMLDMFLFYELLTSCQNFDARLIIIGDINQLPSIGPGLVLKNLINSKCFEVTHLTKIKRQNAGSLVSTIKKMTSEIINYTKFKDDTISVINSNEFINTSTGIINKDDILKLIETHSFNKNTTKFITYFNSTKFKFNTSSINSILQDIFNPSNGMDNIPSNNKYEKDTIFRINDKIIRTENDYSSEKMRANGEEAEILDFDGRYITIKYNDAESVPEKICIDELYDNFKLNYCITIHKSQGSQYDNVVLFIEPNQSIIDKTSLYTAISRARNKCIVVSTKTDFIKCQNNNNSFDNKVSLFMRKSNKYEL